MTGPLRQFGFATSADNIVADADSRIRIAGDTNINQIPTLNQRQYTNGPEKEGSNDNDQDNSVALNSSVSATAERDSAALQDNWVRESSRTWEEETNTATKMTGTDDSQIASNGSYPTMADFLEPSDRVLELVQQYSGFLFNVRQKKSLKDHHNWNRIISFKQPVRRESSKLAQRSAEEDYNESLKEFQNMDRGLLVTAVDNVRTTIAAWDSDGPHVGHAIGVRPRVALRKTATNSHVRLPKRDSLPNVSHSRVTGAQNRVTSDAKVDEVVRPLQPFGVVAGDQGIKSSLYPNSKHPSPQAATAKPGHSSTETPSGRSATSADLQLEGEATYGNFSQEFGYSENAAPTSFFNSTLFAQDELQYHLQDERFIEDSVAKCFELAREDHEYGVSNLLKRQRGSIRPFIGQEYKLPPKTFAFSKAQVFQTGTRSESRNAVRIVLEDIPAKFKPTTKREFIKKTVEPIIYYDKPIHTVPGYSHYVSLEENILCENVVQLTYFPYRGDDNILTNDQYEIELSSRYDFNPRVGTVEIQRSSEAQQAWPYVDDLLQEIDIRYETILEFLLSPEDPCQNIELPLSRESFCNEDFDRESFKWSAVFGAVRGSKNVEIYRAALLCAYWKMIWGWSLWHIVKDSVPVERTLKSLRRKYPQPESIRHMVCCVCLLIDCNNHGEILEFIDQDDEEEYERARDQAREKELRHTGVNGIVPTHIKLRLPWHIENINGINHRKYMVSLPRPVGEPAPTEFPKKISTITWRRTQESWDHYRRDPFYPCNHPGTCESANCSCWVAKIPCEKACACCSGCERRIAGCKCAQKGRPCSNREKCSCFALNRECDPDLCGKCGAKDVLLNRTHIHAERCNNIMIRRNIPRKTHLGTSTIHGLGLYMGEEVQAGEYIGEYKGEIITKAEAERRALIYDQRGTSYLFGLNNKQDVDAMHKGNKMRFLNHSNQRGVKNVHPRVMLVNMVHRIGMYASRSIKPGEELFFDYGWEKDKTEGFRSKLGDTTAGAEEETNGGSASAGTSAAESTAKAMAVKSKGKGKKPPRAPLLNVRALSIPKDDVVDVFENEGEYQGNSGDEEVDADVLGEVRPDSEDESYKGHSDEDVESE